ELDPDGTLLERRKDNNQAGSAGNLTVMGPNLAVVGLAGPELAFVGQAYDLSLTVQNDGSFPASAFGYTYVLTRDGVVRSGTPIGSGRIEGLALGGVVEVRDRIVLSATVATGLVQVGVIIDPDDELVEVNEDDNLFLRPGLVTVRQPVADLAGRVEASSAQAAAGDAIAATVVMRNDGFLPATSFTYAYVLVDAEGDREISRRSTSLPAGGLVRAVEYIDVPDGIPPGDYRLDVVLDADAMLEEIDETNNRLRGGAIRVLQADLQVATDRVLSARLRVPFATTLRAVGGAFTRTWRLTEGALPPGLSLFEDGRIEGTPTQDGVFAFTVAVASGGRTASKPLVVAVDAADTPLAIQIQNLPYALVDRPYRADLAAVGGRAPIAWSATGLPQGLTVDALGEIRGTPVEEGTSTVMLVAIDSIGVRIEPWPQDLEREA
ncbi:MAG: putative Ig domain-containing protein, partial [Planctomycetota bacterium]